MEHKLQFGSTACENGTFVKKHTLQILVAPLFPGISWEILERVWSIREKASTEMPRVPWLAIPEVQRGEGKAQQVNGECFTLH